MARAAELKMPAVAVTEHGNIFGWLDMYEAGTAHGVKPILGMEAYMARKSRHDRDDEERSGKATAEFEQRGPYHLTLLTKNKIGYDNLIKLSSRAYTEGYYVKPRADLELLSEYSEGLIVLSGCLSGSVQQHLLRDDYKSGLDAAATMAEIVGRDNYYIEIHDHDIPEQHYVKDNLLRIAKVLDLPIVATGDCHYVNKSDSQNHDTMLCVSTGARMGEEGRFQFKPEEFYLKSAEEMLLRFPPEYLSSSLAIAEQVELELSFNQLHFPEFDLPSGRQLDEYLEEHIYIGAKRRYGDPLPIEVRDRITHELGVVKRMGFQHYFLVVADLVQWARDNKIRVGPGRGSAAGSILSYVLGITNLDPLKFGLLFERFLVEGRKSYPDIDLDFDDRYRDQVINYARNKYGTDRVSNIITFSRIGARAAIRDASRVLNYEYMVGDRLAKLVPLPVLGVSKTIDESLEYSDFAKAYVESEENKLIIDTAKGLEGLIRQTGMHAAGIVIAPEEITNYIPVIQKTNKKGEKGPLITAWPMERVEQLGLLKIDFLGLTNLGVIDLCVNNVAARRGIEIDVDDLPLDDSHTFSELRKGYTLGIFQVESPGMREMLVRMQPDSIEDIMALISLYRPGPLGSHMDRMYIDRKHGRIPVTYFHPKVEDALRRSYGIMLYQEDVLAVARILAGFSVGEADDLRKVIGKKIMAKIPLYRGKFVEGCEKTSGVDATKANKIYSDIEFFGGYGFSAGHAASYAVICYLTAYLKFNYPAEYMAALLTAAKTKDAAGPYLNECRRMGITVAAPSILRSQADFSVVSDTEILFGLRSVAGIGDSVIKHLVNDREHYDSVYDWMRRAKGEVLNRATIDHLIKAGALDELIAEQPERLISRSEKMELLNYEKDLLGLYVSDHPLSGVWNLIEDKVTCSINELEIHANGELVTIGGLLINVERKVTKRGQVMYVLILEDLSASIEVMVFPAQVPPSEAKLIEDNIVLIEGRIQYDDEADKRPKLIFSTITDVQLPAYDIGEPVIISFHNPPSPAIIDKITQLIEITPGNRQVFLKYPEGEHEITLRFVKPTSTAIENDLNKLTLYERFV